MDIGLARDDRAEEDDGGSSKCDNWKIKKTLRTKCESKIGSYIFAESF